jgi:hypothetical protein
MLDLAIEINADARNIPIIETNHGLELKAPDWPHDCEFQLVGFDSSGSCEVVFAECLAGDIGKALEALDGAAVFMGPKPDWYRSLERCAKPGPGREIA